LGVPPNSKIPQDWGIKGVEKVLLDDQHKPLFGAWIEKLYNSTSDDVSK
jgi:hypothetical protein